MDSVRESDEPEGQLSRRAFLVGSGGVLLAAMEPDLLLRAAYAETPTLTRDFIRRDDMLVLRFEFYNLDLVTGAAPKLVRKDAAKPAYAVVTFTSQHLMEEEVFDDGTPTPPGPGRVHGQAVAPSRIAFQIPSTVKELPFTEEGLLGWWQWVMQVHPAALPPNAKPSPAPPTRTEPGPLQTDLLIVDWLHLSPDQFSTWAHAPRPVTHNGRTELWHTRLAVRGADGKPDEEARPPTLRAVHAAAADGSPLPAPTATEFHVLHPESSPADPKTWVPNQIVTLTSDFTNPGVKPATTESLVLSALGASLELDAAWGTGTGLDLIKWQHRSTLGRDNYVRIERRGYLFPFGHRAAEITETERRFWTDGTAYLFQRQFIEIREPLKTYPGLFQPNDSRRFPFTSVRITTVTTPNLPDPDERDYIIPNGFGKTGSYWIQREITEADPPVDVPFSVVATDWAGEKVTFTCSLAFVLSTEAWAKAPQPWTTPPDSDPPLTRLLGGFGQYAGLANTGTTDPRRTIRLSGQSIAFAPQTKPGDTAYPTATLFLGAEGNPSPNQAELDKQDGPNFYPTMLGAQVRLPAVEALTSTVPTSTIAYDKGYVETAPAGATETNPAELFARLQTDVQSVGELVRYLDGAASEAPEKVAKVAFSQAADKVGGVAIPDLDISALSRKFGPLSGSVESIKDLAEGTFDPKKFLPETANLLGDISLADLLDTVVLADDGRGGPTIVSTVEYTDDDPAKPPKAVVTTMDWTPVIKPDGFGPFVPKGVDDRPARLTLHVESRTELGTGTTSSTIHGELRDFQLRLVDRDGPLSFIALTFNTFTFDASGGAKPNLHVDLATVDFINELSFVNTLKEFLATAGKGPSIDVQPSGVSVGYTLAIPDVAIGVFALQHLSFSAGLTLPFDGKPVTARFGFCSREQKFLVSVYVFAGGGYFALELGSDGLRSLEAAIEFGGNLALDLVVASGSVCVMAGLYFKLEVEPSGQDKVTLTGYLRATGRVSVLGLITITAEFYLGLSYRSADNTVEGEASLTVSIDILFFSTSVTLRVRKSFKGPDTLAALSASSSSSSPEFGELMSQADWNVYCDSFAA